MPLPAKQQRFVEEYLRDLNASAAARRAGYSEKNADKIGPRLVGNSRVAAAVAEAQAARSGRTQVDQDYVLRRLKLEAERLGEGASHAARVAALKLIGQHVGMFQERGTLDAFLASLPPDFAAAVRQLVAQRLSGGPAAGGGGA